MTPSKCALPYAVHGPVRGEITPTRIGSSAREGLSVRGAPVVLSIIVGMSMGSRAPQGVGYTCVPASSESSSAAPRAPAAREPARERLRRMLQVAGRAGDRVRGRHGAPEHLHHPLLAQGRDLIGGQAQVAEDPFRVVA